MTPPSVEEVLADSQSVKVEEGLCAECLRRYARLRSCFVADLGDWITSTVPEDKIVECEDVIIWSRCLSNSRDVAISEKAEACMLSAFTIWVAFKKKLNDPNQDLITSPTQNGCAKAYSFEAESIVV